MNKNFFYIVLFTMILMVMMPAQSVNAQEENPEVNIYIFWGEGCPHCEKARPVLQSYAENDARIEYQAFEVYYVEENRALFKAFTAAYGFEMHAVPTIFVGDRYWEGWSDSIAAEVEAQLDRCLTTGCPDPGKAILSTETTAEIATETPTETATEAAPTATPSVTPAPETQPTDPEGSTDEPEQPTDFLTVPLIGTIDLSKQSLLVSTLLISFIDGFNPCSLWVLSMLLAITLNTRSRKKVLIIGFVFIFVTGFIYALFIGGLFTVFSVISIIGWIRVLIAIVALFFALVNIKDYFWYKEGISFTIRDEKKPGIYKGIRRVLNAGDSIIGLVIGTTILAAGVSLVEFSCTAGLPILWTNLLISHDVAMGAFIGFLLIYMLVYQIDEMGIFLISVFTLRKTKLEEKHGRILKLLGGTLMLCLAVVMLIDPQWMNNVINALIIFGAAFGLTALVLLIHRVILPKFNINTEGH